MPTKILSGNEIFIQPPFDSSYRKITDKEVALFECCIELRFKNKETGYKPPDYGVTLGIAKSEFITVPTQSDLDATVASFNQQVATVAARMETIENIQANLSNKHTEILTEIQNLPRSIKLELVKEALGEMVAQMVREEVKKAMSGEG